MRMNKLWLAVVIPCLALARQEEPTPEPGLRLLTEGSSSQLQRVFVAGPHANQAAERESWTRRLAVSDLDRREAAFDELVGRSRTDDHLRLMLEEFAVDPAQPNRSWTARLALRELNRDSMARALPTMPGQGLQPGLARLLELQLELEDALLRVDDPHFGGWYHSFNQDLNVILGESKKPGCAEESKCFSLEIAPDGVRCKLFECVDGEQVKKEYRADSYGELLDANPELRVHLESDEQKSKGLVYAPKSLIEGGPARSQPAIGAPNRLDQLGIKTLAPSVDRTKKFSLLEGQGLLVVRILPGSLASVLGIRRGDVVAELDEVKIFSGNDVRQVLSERDAKAELRVVVFSSRGQRKELIWKPDF